ncbi:MAG: hypothetical protein LBG74_05135 [Spirochaetaceae bacterium]|nr:hypothetical protein [Spirochaetaceae bacterium]
MLGHPLVKKRQPLLQGSTYYTEVTIANKSSYNLRMETQYSEKNEYSLPSEIKIKKGEKYCHKIEAGLSGGSPDPERGIAEVKFYDADTSQLLKSFSGGGRRLQKWKWPYNSHAG